MEWINVKERLPEYGQYVLGIGGTILRIPHPMRLTKSTEGDKWWYGLTNFRPTHWMPLPDPPKEDSHAG